MITDAGCDVEGGKLMCDRGWIGDMGKGGDRMLGAWLPAIISVRSPKWY